MNRFRCPLLMVAIVSLFFAPGVMSEMETSWDVSSPARRDVRFPVISGYQTLLCDLHTHTVFSDGNVWPTVRVDEAWREGLDVLAITDHIEYLPHKDDIPIKYSRSHDIAAPSAQAKNILFPLGTEITRDTPPGHFNAVFIKDVTPVATDDLVEAIRSANDQGGFVFWNHQAWKGEEKGSWREIHSTLYEEKLLHGMEVCNGDSYYPTAHQWCLDKNLTMLGNSDIHAPSMLQESRPDQHRTMTLVFVREYSLEGLLEALRAGRTAVWYENQLIGREEYLRPLFAASVLTGEPYRHKDNTYWFELKNQADIDFELERTGTEGPEKLTIPAKSTIQVKLGIKGEPEPMELSYEVKNLLIAPGKGLPVHSRLELE